MDTNTKKTTIGGRRELSQIILQNVLPSNSRLLYCTRALNSHSREFSSVVMHFVDSFTCALAYARAHELYEFREEVFCFSHIHPSHFHVIYSF